MGTREGTAAGGMSQYRAAALLLAFAVIGHDASAAPPADTKDWPCQQRLVPTLGAGAFWTEPPLQDAGDWSQEARAVELLERIYPRPVSANGGVCTTTKLAACLAQRQPRAGLTDR